MDKRVYNLVRERSKECCEVCGNGGALELHHILYRKVEATVDNCIMLCQLCHRGTHGIHGKYGHELDIRLKLKVQRIYKEQRFDEDKVRKLMGGRLYE